MMNNKRKNTFTQKGIKIYLLTSLIFIFLAGKLYADGGMYPINQLNKLNLKAAGLKIDIDKIYNPDSISLLQAVVNLGGCTGSFVSEDGLILTNHHCVFSSLKSLSTADNNLMEKGFLAMDKQQELQMKGMTVKIMMSYEDVSEQVLEGISSEMDPVQRRSAISANMKKVLDADQSLHTDLSVQLSEMITGKSYMIIRYQFLKDIRIVYAPQREIGEFGGETDNWMWPRHSGDFAFARAYVSPDGQPAEYNAENVPFKPSIHLTVSADGVQENDFIFILGYPGRTFRNRPADFLEYMHDYHMPFIAEFFEYRIDQMEQLTHANPSMKVKYDPFIKGLANTSKNYRGKLSTMKRIHLLDKKRAEERMILALLKDDGQKAAEYQSLLSQIDELYQKIFEHTEEYMFYGQMLSASMNMRIARTLVSYAERAMTFDKKSAAFEEYKLKVKEDIMQSLASYDPIMDSLNLTKLLLMNNEFKFPIEEFYKIFDKEQYAQDVIAYLRKSYQDFIYSEAYIDKMLAKSSKIVKSKDPFVQLYLHLNEGLKLVAQNMNIWNSSVDALLPRYLELKMEANGEAFLPDANSTFRLTYGYIKGYYPRDGIYQSPFTSLAGIKQKISMGGEYIANDKLIAEIDNLYVENNQEKINKVIVNMLYNADTTGGNSGSPVLNAYGEIVGLNFDRAYEATVNDFAWNDSYSRSIGVDIRYILFVTKEVGKANHLLKELGVGSI
ncbi:MAG: S46 family peptidase [Bacteroidetes bacterium]|nr:S46 family peptidase [Bacteroidota bacterium]MBT5529318.1 S46 family peptidase [Cytophagia bacterium]MBT3422770.1 S46 family peptidase [Bacteroidota bacterium]MBT3800659.1 S46 family peptidase [Bacteroidota bacterium]MBT3934049.1 S46 family peptidase [Bacteroidota bacterium]